MTPSNLTTVKQRPAVVISSEAFNARQQDVMVLAITSQIPSLLGPEDYRLSHEDQRLIRKVLGRVLAPTFHQLTQRLLAILG